MIKHAYLLFLPRFHYYDSPSERMVPPEPVLNQMTAFFGLYTFYSTQPPNDVAYRQPYIHVPISES